MKTSFFILFYLITSHLLISQESTNASNLKVNSVFKYHPNPVENQLFILGTNKIKTVEFIDVLGKRAASYNFNKSIIKIDMSHLTSGIYLLQVIDEKDKVEIKKLVVK